jgi:phosphoglycerate dehydrogenase-like enzyme
MTEANVAILDDFQNVVRSMADWKRLPPNAPLTVFNDHVEGEALVQRLAPFQVVVATRERTPFPRSLIEQLPNLKLLITTGMRNLGIDLAACRERGIVVCGTGSGGSPTAELAWGLILALARHIPDENAALRSGRWQTTLGFTLKEKTLGILGLGKLGSQMARIAQAFGMYSIAWSQNLTAERAQRNGAARVEKAELFAMADVVTVHLLLSERTRGIVGAPDFALMKPTAIFINTARGGLVDEAAMIDALVTRKIAGAGIDVFSREPLPPDAPILAAPNTVLTPHLGYVSRESYQVYFPQALEDIEAWLAGAPIRVLTV